MAILFMMDSHKQLFSLLCLSLVLALLSGQMGLQAEARDSPSKKLFVFGDSYVDTGNTRTDQPGSWKDPYGITFPGKPAGRFSNGRVLTDFIAKYLGLRSPLPYQFRKEKPQYLKYGVNFAIGGTGVFDTDQGQNMTTQIDFLEQLIEEKVYTASDLNNSVALVSVAGNDYRHYLFDLKLPVLGLQGLQGLPLFVFSVIKQTTTNLIRLQKLGVKKILVGALQPLGCLPLITTPSLFEHCDDTINVVVNVHNILLSQQVTKLNQETKDHNKTFVVLDLYHSFMSALMNHSSSSNFTDPLKPCCVGVSSQYFCGSVGENNEKKYKVCENPKSAFFWDVFHPTQAGWNAVYKKLQEGSLPPLLK